MVLTDRTGKASVKATSRQSSRSRIVSLQWDNIHSIERVPTLLVLERDIWPSQYNICVNWAWHTAEVKSSSRRGAFDQDSI